MAELDQHYCLQQTSEEINKLLANMNLDDITLPAQWRDNLYISIEGLPVSLGELTIPHQTIALLRGRCEVLT